MLSRNSYLGHFSFVLNRTTDKFQSLRRNILQHIYGYKTRITLEQNQNVIVLLHCQGATNTLTKKSIKFYQAITYVG